MDLKDAWDWLNDAVDETIIMRTQLSTCISRTSDAGVVILLLMK